MESRCSLLTVGLKFQVMLPDGTSAERTAQISGEVIQILKERGATGAVARAGTAGGKAFIILDGVMPPNPASPIEVAKFIEDLHAAVEGLDGRRF